LQAVYQIPSSRQRSSCAKKPGFVFAVSQHQRRGQIRSCLLHASQQSRSKLRGALILTVQQDEDSPRPPSLRAASSTMRSSSPGLHSLEAGWRITVGMITRPGQPTHAA
jgi:hypothetical protein